jgi:hypothetical protein
MVTYFQDGKLFDKTYVFRTNTINDKALVDLPVMTKRGILGK